MTNKIKLIHDLTLSGNVYKSGVYAVDKLDDVLRNFLKFLLVHSLALEVGDDEPTTTDNKEGKNKKKKEKDKNKTTDQTEQVESEELTDDNDNNNMEDN